MSQMPSLPDDATLFNLFKKYPDFAKQQLPLSELIMRGPSPLDAKERELIATHVSILNSCSYCAGGHGEAAQVLGLNPDVVESLKGGINSSNVDENLKPLLRYVEKLTLTPSRITSKDAQDVYAAGWGEDGLMSAVLVCCQFSFFNRLVEGTGMVSSPEQAQKTAATISGKGYLGILDLLGID